MGLKSEKMGCWSSPKYGEDWLHSGFDFRLMIASIPSKIKALFLKMSEDRLGYRKSGIRDRGAGSLTHVHGAKFRTEAKFAGSQAGAWTLGSRDQGSGQSAEVRDAADFRNEAKSLA
jgi:hypothetical protein